MVNLLSAVILVLKLHGLHQSCGEQPNWAGDPQQQEALAALHRALCDYLPPLPEGRVR